MRRVERNSGIFLLTLKAIKDRRAHVDANKRQNNNGGDILRQVRDATDYSVMIVLEPEKDYTTREQWPVIGLLKNLRVVSRSQLRDQTDEEFLITLDLADLYLIVRT